MFLVVENRQNPHGIIADFVSFASEQARKRIHAVVPPYQLEIHSVGFRVGMRPTGTKTEKNAQGWVCPVCLRTLPGNGSWTAEVRHPDR